VSLFTKGIDETLFISLLCFQNKEREGESEMFFLKESTPLSLSFSSLFFAQTLKK